MSKEQDTQNEPVDKASDDEFMDTGVLHEPKPKGVKGQHSTWSEADEVQGQA